MKIKKTLLSVAGDCRLGTAAAFVSKDVVYTICDNHSNLFLASRTFSNRCIKYTRNINHSPFQCAKNCVLHVKVFQTRGAHDFVLDMFYNCNCLTREFVANDDSRICRVFKHRSKDLLKCGAIDELPKYNNGKVKPDNGELPIENVKINFFTDRNHRVRTVAGEIFKLGRKKNEECICTLHDTERLKRNLSYATRRNYKNEYKTLLIAVRSVLEHHCNDHNVCGD